MNASAVLQEVARTYGNLQSLSTEIVSIDESGDEDSFSRSERRGVAFFVAPDRIRIEDGGRRGTVIVTNGTDLHTYFGAPKRYSRTTVQRPDLLPGWFRPEFPGAGPVFLFSRIAEQVIEAQILREEPFLSHGSETSCQIVSVTYEPSPHPGLTVTSPVTFWVDSGTRLILRMDGEITHRMPAQAETHTNKRVVSFWHVAMNGPISADTFEYTPPADAVDTSDPRGRGGCVSGGGGGGNASFGPDKSKWVENWHSHDWAGDTLIERDKLRLGGIDLTFERRLTFSEDRRELRVSERITGPTGQTQHDASIPVA
jgi:hypothetical protein